MKVALFATCLADTLNPNIGLATVRLLNQAGSDVSLPAQSCCGQANYNAGDHKGARVFVEQFLQTFEGYEYVVTPSGSCAAMLKYTAPSLFIDTPKLAQRMQSLSAKTYELSQFLVEVVGVNLAKPVSSDKQHKQQASYHDSCSGLRTLGIQSQPRALLAQHQVKLVELANAETCCGFGGAFCVKHPEISCRMADDKIAAIEQAGTELLLGGDWGCLMHIQARIEQLKKPIRVKHYCEVLAEKWVDNLAKVDK